MANSQLIITPLSLRIRSYRHFSPSSMQDICHMNLQFSGLRDGPLEKLWGGGGGGEGVEIFEPQKIFFSLSKSLYESFLGHSMNIFSGLLAGMNFFHLIFPWANIFLVPSSPHKFSNDPSLSSHDPPVAQCQSNWTKVEGFNPIGSTQWVFSSKPSVSLAERSMIFLIISIFCANKAKRIFKNIVRGLIGKIIRQMLLYTNETRLLQPI